MSDNYNIDELFVDSLGGLKQNPKEMSWDNIEQELNSSSPSDIQFDNLISASMAGFSVNPSNNVWSGINKNLDNIESLNNAFDTKVKESMSAMNSQASASVWQNIEQELDALDAYRIAERRRFLSWFTATGAIAAMFIYFILQLQPHINFNKSRPQLVNINAINKPLAPKSNLVINSEKHNKHDYASINKNIRDNISEKNKVLKNTNINKKKKVTNVKTNSKKPKAINNITSLAINNGLYNNDVEKLSIYTKDDFSNNEIFNKSLDEKMTFNNYVNNENLLNKLSPLSSNNQSLPLNTRIIRATTGFSIDLFGGPEYINSFDEIVYNEGDNISIKKKTTYIADYSFGANLKYHYNNWFLQSGLAYSNFGDIYSLSQENVLHDTSGGFYSYNINTYYTYDTLSWEDDPLQSGVLVPVLSSSLHTDTVITNWNSTDSISYENEFANAETRYRYIEIPLMLGYQLLHNNWSFLISAGGSYGFKVADEAVYTSNNKLSGLDEVSSPYSSSNINGIISLGITYSVNNKISLILQPTYKTNLTGFSTNYTRYHSLSLRCGINVKL